MLNEQYKTLGNWKLSTGWKTFYGFLTILTSSLLLAKVSGFNWQLITSNITQKLVYFLKIEAPELLGGFSVNHGTTSYCHVKKTKKKKKDYIHSDQDLNQAFKN